MSETDPNLDSPPQAPPVNLANEKLWNVLCHLSTFIGFGLILPLIVYLVTKNETGSTIPLHAREALNFHLSLLIYFIISGFLAFIIIGFLLILLLALGAVVFAIIAAVKASNNEFFHYPLTLRLIK